MSSDRGRAAHSEGGDQPSSADRGSAAASTPGVDRRTVAALHRRLLSELAAAGDWWDGASRRAIMEEARAARRCARCLEHRSPSVSTATGRHASRGVLPAAAVEVIHRVVNDSGRLTRQWAEVQIEDLGDASYAEVVGVTAIVVAMDVYSRSMGDPPHELLPPVGGPPSAERPDDVGDVGAWIAMTEEKLLANVSRALSLVPRTNTTWRALVNESYSRGPQMLDLTWERALTRPQIELDRGAGLEAPGVLLLNVEPYGAAPCEQLSARNHDRPATGPRTRRRGPRRQDPPRVRRCRSPRRARSGGHPPGHPRGRRVRRSG